MDAGNKDNKRPLNPRITANILEVITFSWIFNLLKTGQKRDLEENDLYSTLDDYKASLLGNELEKRWKVEMDKATTFNRKPSFLKVFVQMFGTKFMLYGLIQAFVEIVLRMSQPVLIGGLLAHLSRAGTSASFELKYAYMYASGLLLNILANILLFHYSQIELSYCGMKMRVACCSLIYRKALRLSKSSLGETTIGQVTNLLTNDVNRFDIAVKFLPALWIGPLETILVMFFLWREIGVSSLFGLITFFIFIPIQGWLGKKSFGSRLKTAPKTDERIKLLNEIISGIRIIKMYTWEKPFSHLVQYARRMEIDQIKGATYILVIMQSFTIFHIRFTLFISFLSYALLGNYIAVEQVFIIISYYGIIWTTMTVFFPQAIRLMADFLITIKRIQTYLLYNEKNKQKSLFLKSVSTSKNGYALRALDCKSDTAPLSANNNSAGIVVSNVSAKWLQSQSDYTLHNINLTVRPGRLVTIIGPVGAGKSSLIQLILQELPPSEGSVSVFGTVSYASQEPWLFDGTVRQNILFDSPMDHERYEQVIEVCSLKLDLKQWSHGDRTMVGEKGVSLSGGQRARINLARAVYKQADIYLLDDPLSAVDPQVGNHLFEKCIKGHLREKTCVLVTHQTQHLTSADQIVLIENANVVAEGSYQELQSSGLDFTRLLGSPEEPANESKDETHESDATAADNDLESFSVVSLPDSVHSVSPSIVVEGRPNGGLHAEPVETAETRESGKVSRDVYLSYISAGGNVFQISLLIFICVFTQVLCTGCDFWISYWVNMENRHVNGFSSANNSAVEIDEPYGNVFWWPITRETCIVIYGVLNFSLMAFIVVRCAVLVSFFMNTSVNLHNNMFGAIIRSTMHFFNANSSGRILNRFTTDVGTIDEMLLAPIMDFIYIGLSILGTVILVSLVNVYLLLPTFVVGLFFYYTTRYYLTPSVSVKRLEGVSRSPVISHYNASLQGLTTIRAFGAETMLSKEFDNYQDLHSSAWYLLITSNRAFGFSLDIICLIYLSILIFSFLLIDNETYTGNVGLIITQAINMTGVLQWGIRQTLELENHMISVERILEYTNVAQEAAFESSPDKKPPKEWPNKGEIIFQNLYLRYSLNTPYVLKNLNFRIQPMEKIGIVGRTGAGKSSLIGALYRLAFNEGRIIIDGIEIHELGLHDLRSKISIIPQEPVLFSGTMRKNLDPFDEYPDHALWNALEEVELKSTVEELPNGLNTIMSEGGTNFSVGQRQMVCLARSVLKSNKLIVLDEATANIDTQTSLLIQNTIRNKFGTCTVLTIAHRLNTVMDCDKVLVMDAGTVVEFDHPYSLLRNKDGFFYNMVEQTGSATSGSLHAIAAKSFDVKNKEIVLSPNTAERNVQDVQKKNA